MPHTQFYLTGEEIRPGDTVLEKDAKDKTIVGVVLYCDDMYVWVSWIKWNPAIEAPIKDFHRARALIFKSRSN